MRPIRSIRFKLLNKAPAIRSNINKEEPLKRISKAEISKEEKPKDPFELTFKHKDTNKEIEADVKIEEKKSVTYEKQKESKVPKVKILKEGEIYWNMMSNPETPLVILKDILLRYFILLI
jgi:hypothetical protein